MSTIVTRAGKSSPLTNAEVDSNFTNLNADKVETITSADGSVVVSTSGTTRDLSVGTAASTGNLISQVRNETGAALTKGTVVYISGAAGNKALVSKALATGDTTSAQTYGMVQADIPNNQNGYVVVIGSVSGLNTSAFTDGTQLYLSGTTAGTYTSTKPYAPTHLVYVGIVTYSHATQGTIQVKIQNGYEMDELHDVSAQSATTGQMLVKNTVTGLWEKSNAPILIGATIDNTVIGGTTPAAGSFTSITGTGATLTGASTVSVATWAKWTLETTNVTAKARQGSDGNGLNFTSNALWNGAWVEDDTTKKKFAYIQHLGNGRHEFRTAPTGTGISWTTSLTIDESAVNSTVALQQGGNQVLHAGNYTSYAFKAEGTFAGDIDADRGQGVFTLDPVPSGTPPISSPNIRTLNIGNDFNRRTQLAFNYSTDQAWFRKKYDASWGSWREFIHSGNYSSWALPLSGGTLTGATTLSGGRFYVSSAASGQGYGGTIHIRDAEATGANNSFAGIAFSSSPGADYVIGKYSNSGTGYLEIRNHLGTSLWRMDMNGAVTQAGSMLVNNGADLIIQAASGSTDSGDIVFRNGSGVEVHRLWDNGGDGLSHRFNAGTAYKLITAGNYSSYALPLSGGTVTGQVTFRDSGDTQITLNGNGTTWSGITATDVNGTDYMWVYGATGTWSFGGGGSSISGKKMHIHGGVTIGSGYTQTSNPTNGLNVEGAIQQGGNQVLHAGNYTNYTRPSPNTLYINDEYNAAVNTAGWYTIASYGSGRACGVFHIYDIDSSRHNYVKAEIQWSFGYGGVIVINSGRHGSSTIRHIRLLQNTADQTYGGVKVQVYCENPAYTLRVRQEGKMLSGWGDFSQVTPVQEDAPAGWTEQCRAYYVNDRGVISTSNSAGYLAGNQILHAGNLSTSATANTIAYRDGNGDVTVRELVMTQAVQSFTPSSLVAIYPTTNQAVKVSASGVRTFLDVPTRGGTDASGTWGIGITGSVNGIYINQYNSSNPRIYSADSAGDMGLLGVNASGVFKWQIYGNGSSYGFLNGAWSSWDLKKDLNGALYINGNTALHASNYSSYALPLSGGNLSGNLKIAPTSSSWAEGLSFTMPSTGTWGGLRWRRERGNDDGNWYVGYTALDSTDDLVIGANNGGSQVNNIIRMTKSGFVTFNGKPQADAWVHSDRNFSSGTLIQTDINYAVSGGDPFILEIRGNSYGNSIPFDIQYQGYIYYDTLINHGGYSNGTNISGMVAINYNGNLCFWFPNQSYWHGYYVRVYVPYATYPRNRVTSITDVAKPTTAKQVDLSSNIRQSLHSGNYGSYAVPLSGGTMSGRLTLSPGWTTDGRNYSNEWIEFGNYSGLYSPNNGAHFYPNNASYGSWRVAGSRGGWNGFQFDATNGAVCLMINTSSNSTGFHNPSYGWQTLWEAGTLYVWKNNYGGGTQATVLDSANYTSYAVPNRSRTSWAGSGVIDNVVGQLAWKNYGNSHTIFDASNGTTPSGTGCNNTNPSVYWSGSYPTLMGWNGGDTYGVRVDSSRLSDRSTRANGNFYIDDNYGCGIVGTYTSTRYQGVFAMGDSYKLPADGTTTGSLYGMAWSHPNAGGVAGNLDSHGMIVMINGGFGSCMSYSIKASSNVTAYSDERLKTNWRPMPEDYVARLAQVKVGIYDRIDGEQITQVGVGAQSFQKLLPQAVETAKDEMGTLSVAYGNAALASAVELAKEVIDLRTRVAQLESLISKLIGD